MAPVVIYDACVLYPAPLRDLLIRIARAGIVRARWSERIVDECIENILAKRPDLSRRSLEKTRAAMSGAIADVRVDGYEWLLDEIELPDRDDRHVVAAAVHAGAQAIITANLKDFPREQIARYGLRAIHPDVFVLGCLAVAPEVLGAVVKAQAAALSAPPMSVEQVLDALERSGLSRSVEKIRALRADAAPRAPGAR